MAPGIRSLAAAASLSGALLLTPLSYAVAAGTPSPGPSPSAVPSGRAQASPRTEPSRSASEDQRLAGSRAGEGRTRPGRVEPQHNLLPDAPEAVDPDEVAPAQDEADPQPPAQVPPPELPKPAKPPQPPPPVPTPTTEGVLPASRHHQGPQAVSTGSDLRVHVLSLGAGLTLTGLGLGFLALRLRRP